MHGIERFLKDFHKDFELLMVSYGFNSRCGCQNLCFFRQRFFLFSKDVYIRKNVKIYTYTHIILYQKKQEQSIDFRWSSSQKAFNVFGENYNSIIIIYKKRFVQKARTVFIGYYFTLFKNADLLFLQV